jgi:hypothetical protein
MWYVYIIGVYVACIVLEFRQISLAPSTSIWYVWLTVRISRYATIYIAKRQLSRISTTIGAMGLFSKRCLDTTSDLA